MHACVPAHPPREQRQSPSRLRGQPPRPRPRAACSPPPPPPRAPSRWDPAVRSARPAHALPRPPGSCPLRRRAPPPPPSWHAAAVASAHPQARDQARAAPARPCMTSRSRPGAGAASRKGCRHPLLRKVVVAAAGGQAGGGPGGGRRRTRCGPCGTALRRAAAPGPRVACARTRWGRGGPAARELKRACPFGHENKAQVIPSSSELQRRLVRPLFGTRLPPPGRRARCRTDCRSINHTQILLYEREGERYEREEEREDRNLGVPNLCRSVLVGPWIGSASIRRLWSIAWKAPGSCRSGIHTRGHTLA
eukprot:366239-Chlamydomonas_euryale.AAC.4